MHTIPNSTVISQIPRMAPGTQTPHFQANPKFSGFGLKDMTSTALSEIGKDAVDKTFTEDYLKQLAKKSNLPGVAKEQLFILVDEKLLSDLVNKSNLTKVAQKQLKLLLSDPKTTNLIKKQIYNVLSDPDLKDEARNAIVHVLSDPRNQQQLQKYLEDPELHKSLAIFICGTSSELAKRVATTPYRMVKQFNDNSPALTKLGIGTGLMASGYMMSPVISAISYPLGATLKNSSILSALWGGGGLLWNRKKNSQIWNHPFEKTPIKLVQILKQNSSALSKLGISTGLAAAYRQLPSTLAFLEGPASTLLKASGVGAIGLGLVELLKQYKNQPHNRNKTWNQLVPIHLRLLAVPIASAASTGITAYLLQAQDPQEQSRLFRWAGAPLVSLAAGFSSLCGTAAFWVDPVTEDEYNSIPKNYDDSIIGGSYLAMFPALIFGKHLKTHQ